MMIDEGAYKGRETIKEETDLSFMEERDKRALQDQLPGASKGRNQHGKYLSMEKDSWMRTARSTFYSGMTSPGNFLGPDPRFTARN